MIEKRYKCFHHGNDGGYGAHSWCALYGLFRCRTDCTRFLDKEDKDKVREFKVREQLLYIQECLDEIKGECGKIEKFILNTIKQL